MKKSLSVLKLIFKLSPIYVFFGIFVAILNSITILVNINSIRLIIEALERGGSFREIIEIGVIFVLIYSVISIINVYYYNHFCPIKEQKIKTKFKEMFFKKISSKELISFEDYEFYNSITKVANAIDNNFINTCDYFFSFISNTIAAIMLATTIIIHQYSIIFISIAYLLINIVLSLILNKKNYQRYSQNINIHRRQTYISSLFTDRKYSEEQKIYNTNSYLVKEYKKCSDERIKNVKKYSPYVLSFSSIQKMLDLSFSLIIIMMLSYGVIYNNISLGLFSSLLIGAQNFVSSFSSVFNIIPNLKKESMYINDYYTFMLSKEAHQGNEIISFDNLTININDLSFSYPGSEYLVLNKLNMDIKNNMHIAIIGLNGAGKTTLIKLMIGEYLSKRGSVNYNGIDINDIDREDLFNRIAIIPQNFNIYEFSVAENILMRKYDSASEDDYQKVMDALTKVGLLEKVLSLPEKENTIIGKMFSEKGIDLSGGEKQKLIIARALIKDPELIIMDEPTASLDLQAEQEIIDLSFELFKNKKMIIISHRLSMVLKSDEIYFIEDGKIIEKGTHQLLMQKEGKYYTLFMSQASNFM